MTKKPTKVTVGSLYEMNQQLFKQIEPNHKQIKRDLANIGA